MRRRALVTWIGWPVSAVLSVGCGCTTMEARHRAGVAERKGQYHVAYDEYCKAARRSHSSVTLAAAIRRVAPLAARYWEAQGRAAFDEGRMTHAWRAAIRVLEIQPGDPAALQLVRRIEREHPLEARVARLAWERHPVGTPLDGDHLAMPDALVEAGATPPERQSAPPQQAAALAPAQQQDTELSEPLVAELTHLERATPEPPPVYRFGVRHRVPPRPSAAAHGRYLARHILSRDDDRYERSVRTVDGLTITLEDTDSDPLDADLEVHVDRRRIAELEDAQVGRSFFVTGRSGRWYRLVVLSIQDSSETVIVGVQAADPHQ